MTYTILAVLIGAVTPANTWSVARHDPQRTAYEPGQSDITNPDVAWRYYVGGSLQNNGYWAGDVDGSGQTSVVYAGAGKVIAKHADDTIVWQSNQLFVQSVVDVWDVDGDGVLDVVATGWPSTLVILSGKDGSVEWAMPSSAGIGFIGVVRTADLTGAGTRDLYVADCGCCGPTVNGAAAYSFTAGFASTTSPLWTIPDYSAGTCQDLDVVTDINGDGIPDVLKLYGEETIVAFSGLTGAPEFQPLTQAYGAMFPNAGGLLAASTAGSPVVFFENFYDDSISAGGRRVTAYGHDASTNALVALWDIEAGTQPVLDQVAFDASSLGAFDSTGSLEVAFSLYDSSAQVWTLEVVNAQSGAVIATFPGATYQGTADVNGDGIQEILATSSGLLTSFQIVSNSAGTSLAALGTFPGAVTRQLDRGLSARQATASTVAATPLSSGQDVIVTTGSPAGVYEAVDLAAGPGTTVASFQAPTAATFQGTNLFTDPATMLPQPYLVLSSGFLAVLDPKTFQPTNINSSSCFPMQGLRTGGYLAPSPVVGKLSPKGKPSVVARVSEVAIVRLDPGTGATPANPPSPTWSVPGLQAPSLVDFQGNGSPSIVAADGGEIVAFAGNGTTVTWAASQTAIGDFPFGDANGDGVPDIFYESANPLDGWILGVNVLDGRTGVPLWSTPYTTPVAWGTANLSIGDMNRDGLADAVSVTNNVTYLSGATGAPFAMNPAFTAYGSALISNVLDGGAPQSFLNDDYEEFQPQLDGVDAGTVWAFDAGVQTVNWSGAAALAPCPGGPVFIEGAESSTLYAVSAETGSVVWSETLASGHSYSSIGAVPAGTLTGVLGNTTVKEDLTGAGHMDALVGSSDGYLYAVQACNGGAMDWAYDFGYPVGEPILADSRGTGKDQVLVPVADGYLYALDEFAIRCPGFANATVSGTKGPQAHGDSSSGPVLSVQWEGVPGATGYEWAVYTSAGVAVNSYQSGGYSIRTLPGGSREIDLDATGISVQPGGRYYFAVRAVGANGTSTEAISNTVTVPGTPRSVTIWTPPNFPRLIRRFFELIR